MLCIVAMTAHFVDKIVSTGVEPPKEVVGALSVVSSLEALSQQADPNRYQDLHCGTLLPRERTVLLGSGQHGTLGDGRH